MSGPRSGGNSWFDDGRRPRVGTALLGVFGAGVILAGVFAEDTVAPYSTTNLLHNFVSTIAFVTGIGGVSLISRRIAVDDRWPSYRYESLSTVAMVFVTFVGSMSSVFTESAYVGLAQRVFIGVMTLWVVLQSYRLYRLLDAPQPHETDESRAVSAEG